MTTIAILSKARVRAFDAPANIPENKKFECLVPDAETQKKLDTFKSEENKVAYMLMWANFKIKGKFCPLHKYKKGNKIYVEKHFGFKPVDLSKVSQSTESSYRKQIIESFGWTPYKPEDRPGLVAQALLSVDKQQNGEEILFRVTRHIVEIKKEMPTYAQLASIVGEAFTEFDKKMAAIIKEHMTPQQHITLFSLIDDHDDADNFSKLRKIDQSEKQTEMIESGRILGLFKNIFFAIDPLVKELGFTTNSVRHYSNILNIKTLDWVRKLKDENEVCLMLSAFTVEQFFHRQDTGIDQIVKIWKKEVNTAKIKYREQQQGTEKDREGAEQAVLDSMESFYLVLDEIVKIAEDKELDSPSKVERIHKLAKSYNLAENPEIERFFDKFKNNVKENKLKKGFNQLLFKRGKSIAKTLSPTILNLVFDRENSEASIYEAVTYFIDTKGVIDEYSAPIKFLSDDDQELLLSDNEVSFEDRYKMLLFGKIVDAFKRKKLNLKYSYRHKAIEEDLIPKSEFYDKYDEWIALSKLEDSEDVDALLDKIGRAVNKKFDLVNELDRAGKNPKLKIHDNGKFTLSPDKADFDDSNYIPNLLAKRDPIVLYELLSEVEGITGFSSCFTKKKQRHVHKAPPARKFVLGTTYSLGTNTGHHEMAKKSTGLTEKNLRDTERDFLSNENIKQANDCIIENINKFGISTIFYSHNDQIHTSSDGKKYTVDVDSVLANHSFKYFGRGKGVVINSYTDEKQSFFHLNVLASGEREAHQMLDGVMKSKPVLYGDMDYSSGQMKHVHSSDTHGFTECTFSGLHLAKTAFAPRLKDIGNMTLYAYENKYRRGQTTNRLAPVSQINKTLIKTHWKEILRLMATVLLNKAAPSTVFKKLHAQGEDSELYRALREFGRLLKTHFILTYITDEELRRRIQKQLNRVELGQKLSGKLFHGRNAMLKAGTEREIEKIMLCKNLLKNALILWNYIYLTEHIYKLELVEEQIKAADMMSQGSVIAWAHVIVDGLLNFDELSINSFTTPIGDLMNLQVLKSQKMPNAQDQQPSGVASIL